MIYDKAVPKDLKETQQWFASIITRPIDNNSQMMSISPSGVPMEVEAPLYIAPSPTLKSEKRIELYNQQYWWRLLGVLHDNFPVLTRLFGYNDFNQKIGIPYLSKYPPRHWTLSMLGDNLQQWIDEDYSDDDKQLIKDVALVDWSYDQSFLAEKKPYVSLQGLDLEAFSSQKLTLQPYIYLFEFRYDLFDFRQKMMAQKPDYWLEHDFPELDKSKTFYTIVSRNILNNILYEHLEPTAYKILKLFQEGASIDEVCEWLETQDDETCEQATNNLQTWFHDWTARHWLVLT